MTRARLEEILDGFDAARVAVLGDFFLDKYLIMDPALSEISIETGLEAYQIVDKRPSPGAAGTVCGNLAALGVGRLIPVGAMGDDGDGYELRRGLQAFGADLSHLIIRDDRFTLTYTKPMMRDPEAPGGERELNRMDVKWRDPTPADLEDAVLDHLDACLPEVGAVIIADQVQERNQGLVTDRVRAAIADRAARHPEVVFFADSRMRVGEYRHVMVKPNAAEVARAVGAEDLGTFEAAQANGLALAQRTGRPVFVTLGAEGVLVVDGDTAEHVPGVKVDGPIDIVGAGDSVAAGIVSALCAGATPPEAALLGNLVASITIQQLGTTGTATREQVLVIWGHNTDFPA